MITLYACNFHPPFAHGTVRDIRARWALEEAGLEYVTQLVTRDKLADSAYRAIHPFGKIPALIDDDGLAIFESAAVVLHLGEKHEILLPRDPAGRASTTSWICAAISTLEGPISVLTRIDFFPIDREADLKIRPATERVVEARVAAVNVALGTRDYLGDRFTGADIMVRSVLDMLSATGLVRAYPALSDYMDRCADRPAFQRAMQDHLSAYEDIQN